MTALSSTALCQVAPNAHYRTIATRHFYIHFTPPLEPQARRLAVNAERAYDSLATELVPPRGPIDVVLSDDVDFTNGSATPFPTNRIILYANPPVGESALRFTDDWNAMGITHELTHIFHLDRVRGIWRVGQWVFGRNPVLFPNSYAPSWLTEGLAVYYETRFTGAGRVAGSEHRMIARAAALDHAFPALNQLSLASPHYPFGEITYAYGSLFIDHLARTRGERDVGRFVEKESAELIPFWLDLPAKQAFGISFSRAWRQWSDSLVRTAIPTGSPLPGWRPLTTDAIFVDAPRWIGDSALVYSGSSGRESYGAYRVDLAGRRHRIGRRNGGSPNVVLPDGSLLFAQLDFVNPYQERSDLYVERGGREHRLTRGARLTAPDARRDGAIVAVQIVPAGTRLVRVSPSGASIVPLTGGGMDEQWTEPRWSHAGDRIAAIRWRRGGFSEVVVLDTTGAVRRVLASGHSVQATPSWSSDDAGLFYSSDKSGRAELYYDALDASRSSPTRELRVSSAATGLFEPQLAPDASLAATDGARDAALLAAVDLRARGFQLGVGRCCDLTATPDTVAYPATGSRPVPPIGVDSVPSTEYRMWHGLLPHYWLPTLEPAVTSGSVRFGALTSGSDVVGRHSWSASLAVPSDNSGAVGALAYQNAGFGLPILGVDASQNWEQYLTLITRTAPARTLGEIRRRTRDADVTATWLRQRVRTAFAFTAGVGVEQRAYAGDSAATIALVDTSAVFGAAAFPRAFIGAGWTNIQRPAYSISPEDGLSLRASADEKLRSSFTGGGGPSSTVVGVADAYKSLDLPGFAHHVLAVRVAAGATDLRADGYLEVGGTSGNVLELVPGYTVGGGQRTFGVRGFQPAALYGTRALAGTLEYRAPLFMAGRGLGMLPLFFDRTSVALFADAGTAWCPSLGSFSTTRQVCSTADQRAAARDLTARDLLASVGGELDLTAAVLSWDAPYRFRAGFAVPVQGRALADAPAVSAYFAVGLGF